MSSMINLSIISLLLGAALLFIAWRLIQTKKDSITTTSTDFERFKLSNIEDYIKFKITEMTTTNLYNLGLQEDEFVRQTRRRQELKEALKNCNTGDLSSKIYVKELIFDTLAKGYGFNDENINWVIPFNNPSEMSDRDMFDILLHVYQKKHGKHALGHLIDSFSLDEMKSDSGFRITGGEIKAIYTKEVKHLDLQDRLKIITQRIYAHYKGFGVIDDVRDQAIDGVSGGVSGVPNRVANFDDDEMLIENMKAGKSGLDSIWIMYKGKSIHLSFLYFEHEAEIRRVVQNIYKYNYPGQLSETRPFIINEMHDGSRVTVVRPKFSECWAFFIRKKYDPKRLDMESLIQHKNSTLPIKLIKFLMKGNRLTAITGSQGSGKTTILMAMIRFIRKHYNLRVQETGFELNLRSIYKDRNILSFQETDTISGQDGLDIQKKTDGDVNILGEVATDPVAAWMIQTAQVASLFTIFTHHAKTSTHLVYSLRNSLLKGMFSNEAIAEQQVVSVLEFDIHLRQDSDGSRYIERITEIIPLDKSKHVPVDTGNENSNKEQKIESLIDVATRYFQQQTIQKQFEVRNIIEFVDGEYVVHKNISNARLEEIRAHLSKDELNEFNEFVDEHWGHAE